MKSPQHKAKPACAGFVVNKRILWENKVHVGGLGFVLRRIDSPVVQENNYARPLHSTLSSCRVGNMGSVAIDHTDIELRLYGAINENVAS